MSHVHSRDAQALLDAANLGAHLHPQLGIQIGQRLVEKQHTRLHHQCTGQGNTLLLSAGELVCHALFHALQFHQLKDICHALADLLLWNLAQLESIGHVVKDVVVREQRVALEHHGRIPLVGGQGVDGLSAQIDFALVRAFKAGNHSQRGGLAAAGGTQKGHKGPGDDVQIDVMDGIKLLVGFGVPVDLGNMIQLDALGGLHAS